MAQDLDKRLKQWLQQLAKEWELTIEQVALGIAADEIHNRESAYPKIRVALSTDPIRHFQKNNHPKGHGGTGSIRTNHFSKPGRRSNRFSSSSISFLVSLNS